ncbi:MAG: hypothetical protein ABEJ23_07895 [Haloarculaceae archaeon]
MSADAAVSDLAGSERVLVLSPSLSGGAGHQLCHDLMAARGPGLLYVSLVRSVDDIVAEWRDAPDVDDLAVVSAERTRGGAAAAAPSTAMDVRVEHVTSPDDLTGLGIAVTQVLGGLGPSPAVCLDSLTVLLQYADVEQTFRFLHVLSQYLGEAEASFHAHLDPATQSDQTLSTLSALFDAMVRYQDDEWTVRRQ